MANEDGLVGVRIGGDTRPLDAALDRSVKNVRKFNREATREVESFADRFSGSIEKAAARAAKGLALAGAAAVVASATMTVRLAASVKEMELFANTVGTTVTTLQRWRLAAETVNVENAQLNTMLIDVHKKIAQFVATGGGPMVNFFRDVAPLVGVTAENFKDLSGPQSLQLFYDTLQRANVPQAQIVQHLEDTSGGLSRLIPLLSDGGREMEKLGDEFERTGRVLNELQTKQLSDLDESMRDLKEETDALVKTFASDMVPILVPMADALGTAARNTRLFATGLKEMGKEGKNLQRVTTLLTIASALMPGGLSPLAAVAPIRSTIEYAEQAALAREEAAKLAAEHEKVAAAVDAERKRRELLQQVMAGEYVSGISDPNHWFDVSDALSVFDSQLEEFYAKWSHDPNKDYALMSDGFETGGEAEGENAFEAYDPWNQFSAKLEELGDPFQTMEELQRAALQRMMDDAIAASGSIVQILSENGYKASSEWGAAGRMLVDGFAGNSRKMFEFSKAWAYGDAVVSTASGISKAVAQQNYAAAAKIAATGAVQIAKISKTKFGGKSGSAGGGAGSAPSSADNGGGVGAAEQVNGVTRTLRIEGINEQSRYSGGQVQNLAEALEQFYVDGGASGRVIFGDRL